MTPCAHLRAEPAAQDPFTSPSAGEIQSMPGCTGLKRLPRFGTGDWQDWPSWSIAWGSVGSTENAPGESGAHHLVASDFLLYVLQFSCVPIPPTASPANGQRARAAGDELQVNQIANSQQVVTSALAPLDIYSPRSRHITCAGPGTDAGSASTWAGGFLTYVPAHKAPSLGC